MTDKEKFYPISELKKFKNSSIKKINIITEDSESVLYTSESCDVLEIDKDGNFYSIDCLGGKILFDKEELNYFIHFCRYKRKINIYAYTDLVLK